MSTLAGHTLRFDAPAITRWCGGAMYLAACFPFMSPLPVGVDTQPLSLVFALLMLLCVLVSKGLARADFFLLLAATTSLVYLNPLGGFPAEAGKYVALVAGMSIMVASRSVEPALALRLLRGAVWAYLIGSVLIMLAPDFFLAIQGNFVRAVNAEEGNALGYRGVPTFATEPGLLGGLLVFLLCELRHFARQDLLSRREHWVLGVAVAVTIFLTKSGTGYFYLLLFLGVTTLQDRVHSKRAIVIAGVLVLAVFAGLLALATALDIDNRGLQLLAGIASGTTFGEDTSVLKRVYDLATGLIALREHPFGAGANMVDQVVNQIAFAHGLVREVDYGGAISLVSGLSWMLVAYGLPGLCFLLYIFGRLSRAPLVNKVFALLYFSFSFSPAFPAIWILLSRPSAPPRPRPIDILTD